ncbi:MAG: hypothetical protein KBT33_04850 [Prevotellaceae bacterium]|nr:hypothetical protein [Candidatus Minthosoma equi]
MNIKQIFKQLIPSPLDYAYHIGFCDKSKVKYNTIEWYDNVSWVDTSKYDSEGWFADPFFLSIDKDRIMIFAEEYVYREGKGRLVKMTIDRNANKLIDVETILSLPTHLSYPAIFRDGNKIYVYPENSQSGALKIYEYDSHHSKLVNPVVLIDKPLLDSQLVKINEDYYIFAVENIEGWWEETQTLKIYRSKQLMGPYEEIQIIKNSKNEERGAGLIEDFIRPAQCCEGRYGRETILYKLLFDGVCFKEEEIGRILPNEKRKYGAVLHTYNTMGDLVVIDGYADKYPVLSKVYKKIRGIKQ